MFLLACITTGFLFASAFYLIMQPTLTRLLVGLSLLAPAANLYLFAVGGLVPHRVPLVPAGGVLPPAGFADPLPQALVLTAIVIGLGVQIFFLVLLQQAYMATKTDVVDNWRSSDQ